MNVNLSFHNNIIKHVCFQSSTIGKIQVGGQGSPFLSEVICLSHFKSLILPIPDECYLYNSLLQEDSCALPPQPNSCNNMVSHYNGRSTWCAQSLMEIIHQAYRECLTTIIDTPYSSCFYLRKHCLKCVRELSKIFLLYSMTSQYDSNPRDITTTSRALKFAFKNNVIDFHKLIGC